MRCLALSCVAASALAASLPGCSDDESAVTPVPIASGGGGGASGGGGSGPILVPGTVVARVRVERPTYSPFTLRATVPVVADVFPQSDGRVPFLLADGGGEPIASQVDGVARHPNGSFSVVELSARVDAPEGSSGGDMVEFDVMFSPFDAPAPPPVSSARDFLRAQAGLPSEIDGLLDASESLLLVGWDMDGNRYAVDLLQGAGSTKPIAAGPVQSRFRTYGTMELVEAAPTSASGCGAYPHLFGVHAYFAVASGERALRMDLRFHNGFSGLDPSDPNDDNLGEVYFQRLELWYPEGWALEQQAPDPYFGGANVDPNPAGYAVTQLVRPMAEGTLHLLPRKYQVERRLVLVPTGSEAHGQELLAEAGLGFVVAGQNDDSEALYSWDNPATSAYLPPGHRMPTLASLDPAAVRAGHQSALEAVTDVFVTGGTSGADYVAPVLGPVHPKYPAYGGVSGGGDILFVPGVDVVAASSRAGYVLTELDHRGYNDRQRSAFYDANGEPTSVSDWLQGDEIPFTFSGDVLVGDPFGYESIDTCMADHVASNPTLAPAYQADILEYAAIDSQHLVRYSKNPKVLVWLGNDAMSADDLKREAEIAHLSLHEHWYQSGQQAYYSLQSRWQDVSAEPHTGFGTGRGDGWRIDVVNAYYRIADDDWRAAMAPWYALLLDTFELGQADCFAAYGGGFFGRVLSDKFEPFGDAYWGVQPWEDEIVANALLGARASVYQGVDTAQCERVDTMLDRLGKALMSPMSWSHHQAPPHQLAVAYRDPFALICDVANQPADGWNLGPETFYSKHFLGSLITLLGDPSVTDHALEMIGQPSVEAAIAALEHNAPGGLPNEAVLLEALQRLP